MTFRNLCKREQKTTWLKSPRRFEHYFRQPLQQLQSPLHFFFLGRNSSHAMYPPMAASSA